ncbi:MAG: GAF domain-containing protein, partial [Nocardioides sp.]
MAGSEKRTPGEVADAGSARDRELSDAREQAVATGEILLALSRAGADPGEILDKIVERAARLCRAQSAQLFLLEAGVLRLSRTSGVIPEDYRQQLSDHPMERGRASLSGRVLEDRRTQQISDVLADADYGRQDLQQRGGFRTAVSAPMMLGEEVVGVLSAWRTAVAPFSETEMRRLDDFATQAAIALRQVALMRSLEARGADLASKVQELEALREVGEAVSSILDPKEVLDRIVTNAVRLTGTDGGSIMEYDERADAFLVRATHGSSPDLVSRLRRTTILRST